MEYEGELQQWRQSEVWGKWFLHLQVCVCGNSLKQLAWERKCFLDNWLRMCESPPKWEMCMVQQWHPFTCTHVYEGAFPEWIWMSLPHVKSHSTGCKGLSGVAGPHTCRHTLYTVYCISCSSLWERQEDRGKTGKMAGSHMRPPGDPQEAVAAIIDPNEIQWLCDRVCVYVRVCLCLHRQTLARWNHGVDILASSQLLKAVRELRFGFRFKVRIRLWVRVGLGI